MNKACVIAFVMTAVLLVSCSERQEPAAQEPQQKATVEKTVEEKAPPVERPEPEPQDEITVKVISILAELMSVDKSTITVQSSLAADLGADDLDQVEFIMEIEDAFDLMISDEEMEAIKTVKDAIECVKRKKSAGQ